MSSYQSAIDFLTQLRADILSASETLGKDLVRREKPLFEAPSAIDFTLQGLEAEPKAQTLAFLANHMTRVKNFFNEAAREKDAGLDSAAGLSWSAELRSQEKDLGDLYHTYARSFDKAIFKMFEVSKR